MSSGQRIAVLVMFAAAGVGLAICLATSDTLLNRHVAHVDRSGGMHPAREPAAELPATATAAQVVRRQETATTTPALDSTAVAAQDGKSDPTEVRSPKPFNPARLVQSKAVPPIGAEIVDVQRARFELRQPIGISPSDNPLEPKNNGARLSASGGAPEPPFLAGVQPSVQQVSDIFSLATKKAAANSKPDSSFEPIGSVQITRIANPVVTIAAAPRAENSLRKPESSKPFSAPVILAQATGERPGPAAAQQIPVAGSPQVRRQVQDELSQMRQLLEAAQNNASADSNGGPESLAKPNPTGAGSPSKPSVGGPATAAAPPVHAKPKITRVGEGDEHLTLDFQEADIRDVLEMISTEGQLNILPSNSVKGKVSASLHDVDLETALSAILKSTGYVTRRHGKFIYVGTTQDFQSMEQSLDRVGTRIYRTNYVRAADLQALVTPLLTQGVGAISVTVASEQGIAADSAKAGGDTFAGGDAVLVRDYEAVLAQIDQVVAEIDRRPLQVAIEAMILSVKLDDGDQFGINFQLLRDKSHLLLASGSPATNTADVNFNNGGLTFGFLDTTLGAFLSAVETIGDTHVIATPRVVCINKHRAEILIGSQLGYVSSTVTETSTAQNVNFLEVGTQLRLRPFISSDGLIRMEVHPELSTGQVTIQQGFTLPQKDVTQVTTNVMVRDGATVVIGGLIREDLSTNTTQIPLLGNLPGVGFLFRQKNETTQRSEILVLITPHIVYDNEACAEGSQGAEDFHRREAVYADQMSPLGKRHLGRQYLRLAQEAWAKGDQPLAIRFVDLSIHFDPLNRAAIDLRSDIMTGDHFGRHTAVNFPVPQEPPADGQPLAPWMLNALEQPPGDLPGPTAMPLRPFDPGVSGGSTNIERPRQFQPQ